MQHLVNVKFDNISVTTFHLGFVKMQIKKKSDDWKRVLRRRTHMLNNLGITITMLHEQKIEGLLCTEIRKDWRHAV